MIIDDFKRAFDTCDIIVSPVAPTPALKIGAVADDPLTMYLSDIFTLSANLAGIPGISLPCGFSSENLPIGLQIMARHFAEDALFKVAYNFEQATDYHKKKPKI
jgi:aspartyl-tRNA(Asn)/glutamyl-tRNA(Gln) amidotransferase subunit A